MVLIERVRLGRLMVENSMGASIRQVYQVRQLDSE